MADRRTKLAALARVTRTLNEPQPIPLDDALLDCFDLVVVDDELDALLAMGVEPHSLAGAGLAPALLASLTRKDLIVRGQDAQGDETVHAAPFLPGWFESQLCDGGESAQHHEFARRVERLFDSWRAQNNFFARFYVGLWYRLRSRPFQTIAAGPKRVRVEVDRAIAAPPVQVRPTRSVVELLRLHGDGSIALIHCFCRQLRKLTGDPCRFEGPREVCLQVGEPARRSLARGVGRPLGLDEAIHLLSQAQRAGVVHTVFHDRDDAARPEIAVCSCCWDCCGVLGTYNRGAGALYFKCYELAHLADPARCRGCGTCTRFCPVDALRVVEGRVAVQAKACIGCGQCAFQCPRGALALRPLEREVFLNMRSPAQARLGRRDR